MDKAEFDQFVDYYYGYKNIGRIETISHLYEKFGREFIFDLPVEYRSITVPYTAIKGTNWMHSTIGPTCYCHGKSEFYILGHCVSLDEWLPLSALSPEEQIMFKLKYG